MFTEILNIVKRLFSGKAKFVTFGIIILLSLILFRKSEIKVETAEVQRGEIIESVSASGEVDAEEKADLTFQSSGRLAWVGVKEGGSVTKYQAIAKLDTVILNASYQQAVNTYRAYEAAAQKAEDDVKGHDTDETYAQKSTRMAAQVARDNAYDAMKTAEQNLKYATITSPFDGIVTSANPSYPGSNVTYLNAVYSVVNPETFYFNCEVGEDEISKIRVGQKVVLYLDAYPEDEFESTVESVGISSVTTSTGGTAYKVKIDLSQKEGVDFRLGMNGNVEIVVNTHPDVLSIPTDAVIEEDGGNYVWVVTNGKVKKVKIEVGASSIEKSEIKEAIWEGDIVVISPPTNLKNGIKIGN